MTTLGSLLRGGGLLLIGLAGLAFPALAAPPTAPPEEVAEAGVNVADLRQQLVSKLLCRRDEEYAFVDKVVLLVNQGTLPVPIVNGAYNFAIKHKPYPFPYFQRALIELAARAGIRIE